MRMMLAALTCTAALLTGSASATDYDSLKTRFGILRLQSTDKDFPRPDKLVFGKTLLLQQENEFISLYHRFELGNQDVVLVGVNCGGTGCPNDDLSLVVLAAGQVPQLLSDHNFHSNDGTVKPEILQGRMLIGLGFEAGKVKRAVYDGQALKIELSKSTATTLPEKDCKWSHEYIGTACMQASESDPACKDPQSTFPGMIGRGITAIDNHPGFNDKGFERLCWQMCRSGKLVSYDQFKRKVCQQ